MSMPENPPAFPNTGNATWGLAADEGMSLRDYFAGQALGRLAGNDDTVARASWTDEPEKFLADWAYRIADAMLAERSTS